MLIYNPKNGTIIKFHSLGGGTGSGMETLFASFIEE